jgi:hypothetical protein
VQASPAPVGPVFRIDWVHPGRMHSHPDLALSWHRVSDLLHPQLLRAAELADYNRLQPRSSSPHIRTPARPGTPPR